MQRLLVVLTVLLVLTSCEPRTLLFEDTRIPLLPGKGPLAGYMSVANGQPDPVRIVAVRSDDFGSVMMHRTVNDQGTTRMRHLDQIVIESGETVVFRPGDLHLMLMMRQRELQIGEVVNVEFEFADGDKKLVAFPLVQPFPQ